MIGSLAIAAPPLLVLLLLLWVFERRAGRSGALLLLSVFWGGVVATSLVTGLGALWIEQPLWYPYTAAPIAEELAKGGIFVIFVALRLLPGVPAGLGYGLACGLGFAMWENAAYFERAGGEGPPIWLYLTRTAGAALLHAVSTGIVGAAAGAGGLAPRRGRHAVIVALAVVSAVWIHGGWNYVCLVLSDNSPTRRALPLAGVSMLFALLAWAVVEERRRLREEVLDLWRDGLISEDVARAMVSLWSTLALRRVGVERPARLARAIWSVASARRQAKDLPTGAEAARERVSKLRDHAEAVLRWTLDPRGEAPRLVGRRLRLGLILGLGAAGVLLHLIGRVSPVPATLARRTIVIASSQAVRPEPAISLMGEDTYVLWQRGPTMRRREQMLTWIGPAGRPVHRSLGPIPELRPDWYEIGALGEGVAIATRDGDALTVRAFHESEERGEIRISAPEEGPEPCWPWMTTDRGRTLLAWDRLRRGVWLRESPLGAGEPISLPDAFPEFDSPQQACTRGLMLTDDTLYEVARPWSHSRMAAIDLERRSATPLEICPDNSALRVHSLDKDHGQVLVLMGGRSRVGGSYRLFLTRLDRDGHVLEACRPVRDMPAGAPAVVGLAGAGDDAFLAWSTVAHVFLARFPLREGGSRPRRWVLDRAPRAEPGVVRVGVVDERLFVAWEGRARDRNWSLKLLRVRLDDLP